MDIVWAAHLTLVCPFRLLLSSGVYISLYNASPAVHEALRQDRFRHHGWRFVEEERVWHHVDALRFLALTGHRAPRYNRRRRSEEDSAVEQALQASLPPAQQDIVQQLRALLDPAVDVSDVAAA